MSGSYAQRYSYASQKPPCYGDTNVFDLHDRTCIDCPVFASCRYQVEEKITRAERLSHPGSTVYAQPAPYRPSYAPSTPTTQPAQAVTGTVVTPQPNSQRSDPPAESGWWGTLWHNGALNMLTSFAQEGVHALLSIPRYRYKDPRK